MKRIMIIGCGGSGKSTLAVQLGQKLGLPVHHLDRLFWQPGWTSLPRNAWQKTQERLCAEPEWILDGNYGGTMNIRISAADTIIFLDASTLACLIGATRRFLRFRGRTRPDMTEGCPERLEWDYLKWIWTYRRARRPGILQKLKELEGEKRIIVLTSRRAVRAFLNGSHKATESRPEDVAEKRAERSV